MKNPKVTKFVVSSIVISVLIMTIVWAETTTRYVDGFDSTTVEWTETGDTPYLSNSDLNYIVSDGTGQDESDFSFADLVGADSINSVDIYFEVNADTSKPVENFDVFIYDGDSETDMGTIAPTTNGWDWYSMDISSKLDTVANVDAATLRVVSGRKGTGIFDALTIRRAYLDVDYEPTSGDTCTCPQQTAT